MKDLLLVGATGLVGQSVLRQALADSRVAKLVAVTRKPLLPQPSPRKPPGRFRRPASGRALGGRWMEGICTLGTTMRQAGSHNRFPQSRC